MSVNQKEFFKNKDTLVAKRLENSTYAAWFGIALGALIIIQGILTFILR
jgi:hypothetical protein